MTLASRNSPAGLLTESVTKTTFTETTVIIGDNNDVDDDIENGPDLMSSKSFPRVDYIANLIFI